MPRLGLDFALDSLGGGLGSGVCISSIYSNGIDDFTVANIDGSPATGPVRFVWDMISYTSPSVMPFFDKDESFEFRADIVVGGTGGDKFVMYENNAVGNNTYLIIQKNGSDKIQIFISDAAGAFYYNKTSTSTVTGDSIVKLTYTHGTNTFEGFIDGVQDSAFTLVTVPPLMEFDLFQLGARKVTSPVDMDLYYWNDAYNFGNIDTVTRLTYRPNEEPDFLDGKGNTWALTSFGITAPFFPYQSNAVAQWYLEKDCVAVLNVVWLGDSNGTGLGLIDVNDSFPNLTYACYGESNVAVEFTNLSFAGYTSYECAPTGYVKPGYVGGARPAVDTARNITYALTTLKAKKVYWSLGTNDIFNNYSEGTNTYDEHMAILNEVIALCAVHGAELVIVTCPAMASTNPARAPMANGIAAQQILTGESYVDANTLLGLGGANNYYNPALFQAGDEFHYNPEGHLLLYINGDLNQCDLTTYFNGVAYVDDPFVDDGGGNMVPATGPIKIDAIGATNDAVIASISFDASLDETFTINTTLLANVFSADVLFTLTDAGGASYLRVQYIASTGKLYMEGHDGTSYSYMDSDTAVLFNENYDIGFNLSGIASNKLITMNIDGVSQTDTANLDFTGVIFNNIVLATSGNYGAQLKLLLYSANSTQLGNTSFVSRLPVKDDPNVNTFTSDATIPVVYTLNPQIPFTEYYPYFTLGFGAPDAFLLSDTPCAGNNLVTNNNIAVTNNGEFVINTP